MRSFLLTLAASIGLAAPAHAAYAPRVDVDVEPPTAGSPVALALTVTQQAGEEATRSARLLLPSFGTAAGAGSRPACTGTAAATGACPAQSRIGTATSSTSFGTLSGGVFAAGGEGERIDLLAVLANPLVPVVLDQRFTGTLTPVPGGRQLALDGLPGATATRLHVALEGDDRALVATPSRCGAYDLVARLVAGAGETAERTTRVAIGGCPGEPPTLAAVRLAPARRRAGAPSALTFLLGEAATVRITARRSGTRRARTLRRMAGRPGANRARGLGRRLAPGRWFVTVRAADEDGATARTRPLRVLRRARG